MDAKALLDSVDLSHPDLLPMERAGILRAKDEIRNLLHEGRDDTAEGGAMVLHLIYSSLTGAPIIERGWGNI